MTEAVTATYTSSFSVITLLISFLTITITTLGVYIILSKLTSNFKQKFISTDLSIISILKFFIIGLITLFVTLLLSTILILSIVGVKLALILVLLFATLCLIAVPCLAIFITNKLKDSFKIEKNSMFFIILSLVSIILYSITLIPFVGVFLGVIIKLTSVGLFINTFLPHKELTDEEKAIKEEKKKAAKENKEKTKKEKAEAKMAKKQAKLEAKESKKNNNTDL